MPGPTSRAEARRARMAARNAPPSPASAGGWGPSISEFASGYGERAQEVGGALKSLIRSPYDIYRNMQTPEGFKASVEGFKEGAGSAFGGFFSDPLQAAGNVFDPGVQSVVEQAIDPTKDRSAATKGGRAAFDLSVAALPFVGKYAKPAVKGAAKAVREAEMFAPKGETFNTLAAKKGRSALPSTTNASTGGFRTTTTPIPNAAEAPTNLGGFSIPRTGVPGDSPIASPYRNPGRVPLAIPEAAGPGFMSAWRPGASSSGIPPPPNFYGGSPGIPSEVHGGIRLGTVEAGVPKPVSAGMGRTSDAQAAFEAMVPDRYKSGVTYDPDLQNMEGAIGPVAPPNPRLGTVTARGIKPAPAPPGTKSVAQMVQEYGVEETARKTGMTIKEVKAGRILDKEPKVTVKVAPRNPPPAPQPKPKIKSAPVVKEPTMEEKLRGVLDEVQRNPPPPVDTAPSTRVASGARPLAAASDEAVGAQAARGNKSAQRELALREQEAAGTIEQPKPQGPNVTKQNATRDYLQGMVDRGEAMDLSDARTILQRAKEQPRTRNVGTGPLARLRSESGAVGRNVEQRVIDPGDSDFDFLDRPEYNLKDRLQRLYEDESGAIKFKNLKEEDFHEIWKRLQRAQRGEVHSGFATNLLSEHDVDPARAGLQMANADSPYYKQVVYRDPRGKPIIVAELSKTREGDWGISSFGADPNLKGSPLMGKAMHKTTMHLLDDLGVRGPSTSISDDTRNYMTKLVTRGTGKTAEELDAMFPPPPRNQRYQARRSPVEETADRIQVREAGLTQSPNGPSQDAIARLRRELDAAGLQRITDDQIRDITGIGNPINYPLTPQPSRRSGGHPNNLQHIRELQRGARERAIARGEDPSIYAPDPDMERLNSRLAEPGGAEARDAAMEAEREAALQRVRDHIEETRPRDQWGEHPEVPARDRWDEGNPDAPDQNLPDGEQSFDYEQWVDAQERTRQGRGDLATQQQLERGQAFVDEKAARDARQAAERERRYGPSNQRRNILDDETGAVTFDPRIIKKAIGDVGNLADQARMTSMLSGLALPKSLLGNVGAHIAAAAEQRSMAPIKALGNFREIGRDLKTGWQQGHNPTLQAGFGRFNIPGRTMGAADYAATRNLQRSMPGRITEDYAKELLLTESNPVAKWKPLNTPLGKLLVPFKTTPFNQLGQGLTRGKKHKLVYGGSIAAGAGAGALTDDPETLALASALAGPYALPMLMGASLTAGPRALQGVSPIPEWSITKTLTEPWAPFTESPGARWFENNLGFGKPASETSQTKRTSVRRSNVTR